MRQRLDVLQDATTRVVLLNSIYLRAKDASNWGEAVGKSIGRSESWVCQETKRLQMQGYLNYNRDNKPIVSLLGQQLLATNFADSILKAHTEAPAAFKPSSLSIRVLRDPALGEASLLHEIFLDCKKRGTKIEYGDFPEKEICRAICKGDADVGILFSNQPLDNDQLQVVELSKYKLGFFMSKKNNSLLTSTAFPASLKGLDVVGSAIENPIEFNFGLLHQNFLKRTVGVSVPIATARTIDTLVRACMMGDGCTAIPYTDHSRQRLVNDFGLQHLGDYFDFPGHERSFTLRAVMSRNSPIFSSLQSLKSHDSM